jgi:hypothetical protein
MFINNRKVPLQGGSIYSLATTFAEVKEKFNSCSVIPKQFTGNIFLDQLLVPLNVGLTLIVCFFEMVKYLLERRSHSVSAELAKYEHIFECQQFNWDCGIACCNMVIKWTNKTDLIQFNRTTTSNMPLWTIELFCWMKEMDFDVCMYTNCKGVNPKHASINWYATGIENEEENVQELFAYADSKGWLVHQVCC